MGQRILALELGRGHVRAAMADRSWNGLELLGAYEQRQLADEPDLRGALARVVTASGRPDLVISAMPGEFVAKRLLTLPFNDRRRLRQVVAFALEEHLPFAVEDAAVAFARVGRVGTETLVIAAFARKEDIHHHLETLATAGLDPKTVTLSTLALAGLLSRARNGAGPNTPRLVLDVDHGCTSMVLIDGDGTPRAMRTLGQGVTGVNGAAVGPPATAAILGAVRQTLLAHASEREAPTLVLAGPGAASAELRDQIAGSLSTPIHDLAQFDCSALIPGVRAEPRRFAGCFGMLLGEAPAQPLELLNFREGEFAYHGRSGAIAPLRNTALLAAAAIVVAVLHLVLSMAVSVRGLHLLNREIESVTAPALGSPDGATARADLQRKLIAMEKRLNLLGSNLGHGSPLDVMLALSRAIPPGLRVRVTNLSIDDSGVKIEGTADSFATVDQLKHALQRIRDLGAINVEHAAAGSDPSKVDFRLTATGVGAGDGG